MHATDFGRTLIIANPAAQSGAAREVAERLQRFLDMTARASQFDLVLTERIGHAKKLAAQAQGYRTVIALGGDGVIHEVVNGLMTQKEDARPALAVLPVGSGNDFAQTLGIDDFSGKDFGALLTCELQRQDIGRIRSWNPASGSGEATVEYYDQTLSVGIDAAIGLGTTELRKKTGLTGAPLYTLSGLEQFGLRYRNYPMTVSFDRRARRAREGDHHGNSAGPHLWLGLSHLSRCRFLRWHTRRLLRLRPRPTRGCPAHVPFGQRRPPYQTAADSHAPLPPCRAHL